MKVCSDKNCTFNGQSQPLENFCKRIASKDGFSFQCKICRNRWLRQYYSENKECINSSRRHREKAYQEEIKQYRKAYYEENKEGILKQQKEYNKVHKEQISQYRQSLNGRYSTYKKNSNIKKIIFSLTLEEFDELTKQTCFYCGEYSKEKTFVGIDKIVPDKGYILENCVPCCEMCNFMKNNFSQVEFYEKIEKIYMKKH